MIDSNEQAEADLAMLDLFKTEVAIHTQVLKENLQKWENDPKVTAEQLDAVMQGTHAIWGGSRIVELDAVSEMAQKMKNYFSALQKGNISLKLAHLDFLFQGVDILVQLAETANKEITTWVAEYQEDIDGLLVAIAGITEAEENVSKSEALVEDPTSQDSNALTVATPPQSTQPTAIDEDTTVSNVDPAMMELFKTEVDTNVALLNDGLLSLEEEPTAKDKLEALMRGAHSIKGAARVVGLDIAVKIAHVMEDCFVAAQKDEITLASEHIDILLQGVDMLTRISQAACSSGGVAQLADSSGKIELLATAITSILTGETITLPLPSEVNETEETILPVSFPDVTQEEKTAQIAPTDTTTHTLETITLEPPEVPASVETVKSIPVKKIPEPSLESIPPHKKLDKDRMVRVTASKIESLMGLAGEVVVSARWLPPFSQSLLELKRNHVELSSILERLQDLLGQITEDERALKLVGRAKEKTKECNLFLADKLNELDIFTSNTATHSDRLYHEVIGVRMRPFSDGVLSYPRMVRDLAKELGKKVRFEIIGKFTEVDQDIQEKLDAPLNHLLRNALDHGIELPAERLAAGKPEQGSLRLEVGHRSGMLMITVADDGRGIELGYLRQKILQKGLASLEMVDKLTETELMEFLFLPGFSTTENVTEISGRGVGLDVVHNMVHEVGGVVRAVSTPGRGLSFHLELPLTLSVIRTFLVEIATEPYAFPLARIDRCLILSQTDIDTVEDRQYFRFGNNNIALVNIHDVLEMSEPTYQQDELAVVVVSDRRNSYGLVVDKFLGESDLVVRPLDSRLGKVPDISAVAVMLDGSPVLIFDVEDLVRSIDNLLSGKRLRKITESTKEAKTRQRVLVIDDSITVREMERKLLENSGYDVEVAVDGMDGWNAVRTEHFDLIVSDVDMPRMNGIEFINHVKQHEELKSLPVIIVSYKDTKEHRLQGLEAGANYYLTKSSFEDNSFIEAVKDLIGEAY